MKNRKIDFIYSDSGIVGCSCLSIAGCCRKMLLMVAFLVFLPGLSLGQVSSTHDMKRVEFELHVGPAIPLGDFGSQPFQMEPGIGNRQQLSYHGARIGVNYGAAFNFYISHNLGVGLLFNGHSHKVSDGDYSSYQWKDFNWATSSVDQWTEFTAMIGPTYRAHIVGGLVLGARAYLGYAHLRSPFYSSEADNGNGVYTFKLNSGSENNFGFGAGVNVKYMITPNFHLDLRCDYMGALPFRFEGIEGNAYRKTTGNPTQVSRVQYDFTEKFHVVNVSLGITISFGN